jgi:adenylosuccinate lyase
VPLWHERDISHSSVERVIGPDACLALDFMLVRLTGILRDLVVHPDRMEANAAQSGDLVFSETLLLALVHAGVAREEGYRWVQRSAFAAMDGKGGFREIAAADPDIARTLDAAAIARAFDRERHRRHADRIVDRALAVRPEVPAAPPLFERN